MGSDPQVDTPSGAECSSTSPGVRWVSGPPLASASYLGSYLVCHHGWSKEAGFTGQTASPRVRDRVIMLSWCPVQRSKASTRVRDRVMMLSWCPVQRSKASTRVRGMLSWCPVKRSKASTRVRDTVLFRLLATCRSGHVTKLTNQLAW